MALCRFCNKWMEKGTGKRQKEFCNNNCRSNFWYSKNKKKVDVLPPKKVYDSEKLLDDIIDEPLTFSRLQTNFKSFDEYRTIKRGLDSEDDWEELKAEILASNLTAKQKETLTTTNL